MKLYLVTLLMIGSDKTDTEKTSSKCQLRYIRRSVQILYIPTYRVCLNSLVQFF